MGGGFEEHGGLAADDFHVDLFGGAGVADLRQLQHLALGDDAGGLGDDAHHFHGAERHHHLEGAGIEEIAHQDAGGVAPEGVGGGATTAHSRGIDDIVVQQGGGVQEFDGRRQQLQIVIGAPERLAGQQDQQRTQALATRGDDVVANLLDQRHARGQLLTDDAVYGGEIVRHHAIEGLGLLRH